MAKCTRKGEFHFWAVFSTEALLRDGKRAKRDVKRDAKRDAWHNGNLKWGCKITRGNTIQTVNLSNSGKI